MRQHGALLVRNAQKAVKAAAKEAEEHEKLGQMMVEAASCDGLPGFAIR
jgi:hypothetical protein